ncbi:MAG: SGNH/GDSL hydrolase family protein [Verrucomicrobia bacterium]|jgi:lysophospholipase L1-like esterase|nr:MAG: SGNH/GDSL hydrolase family protein [Verrucomicrobiota bacterium]
MKMKRFSIKVAVVALVLSMTYPAAAAEIPAALRGVKRIVFLGDSITQQGDYVVDFDCWLLSRGINIEVLNLGLASETASDLTEEENAGHKKAHGFGRPPLSERMDRVISATKPDVIIACFGMNDGGDLPADDTGTKRYAAAMTKLHDAALKAGVRRVVLCTPPPHDAKGNASQKPHDENLTRYSEWLLSKRSAGWDVVDIHGPMRRALDAGRAKDPSFALANDGVHPGSEGHWMMASAIVTQFIRADLEGIASSEQLFKADGKEIHDRVRARMTKRFSAWMRQIGHTRPGVPGGPGTKPGLSVEAADVEAAQLTKQILEQLSGGPKAAPKSSVDSVPVK